MSAVLDPPTATATPWRSALLALAAVMLVLGGLYADTVTAMVGIWQRSETFAHAFLVPPIVLWLVWRQRATLAEMTPRPQPWVLLAVAAFAAMWLLADLMLVNAAAQFAWVAMLVLSVPVVLGVQVALVILFPLLFLFFAVPMGEFMLDPMMQWTADFTVAALRLSGIPVYREGLQFVIPSGSWSVVEACSGVRYLIASFMVGTLFAYLNYRSWTRRTAFMLVSIAVPIVANWLRAYMIVMLGHWSDNTLAVGADHLVYGWVFFGVVVMIMFLVGARWSEPDATPAPATAPAAAALQRAAVAGRSRAWPVLPAAAATVAVLLLPHLALWSLQRLEQGAAAPQLALPDRLANRWQVTTPAEPPFKPAFRNPALEIERTYASPDGDVGLYLGYYRHQGENSKLVGSANALVISKDRTWNLMARGGTTLALDGRPVSWRTAELLGTAPPGRRRPQLTAWQVYWVDGRWVAGDIGAKLAGALTRLQGRGDDGAVLVLWADRESSAEAQALLQAFVRDNLPALEALLRRTRDLR